MTTVGFCEIEPFCQRVLKKHWPDVPLFEDVRNVTGELVRERCGHIDLICAGVPCQPASVAGKRKGASDDRWMWPQLLRLVSEIKPMLLLAENPRGITSLRVAGMQFSEWIAREFAARGYELLPVELAAEDVGAPHRRERVFFVAYSSGLQSERRRELENLACETRATESNSAERKRMWHAAFNCGSNVANADSVRQQQPGGQFAESGQWAGDGSEALANTSNARLERQRNGAVGASAELALSSCFGGYQWPARPGQPQHGWEESRTIELPLGGTVAGLPVRLARRHRVSALKALGNAVVPQVAEVIGRAIMEASQNELR